MKWPAQLVLIRHGESEYNAAKKAMEQDPEYQEFVRRYEVEAQNDFQFTTETQLMAARLARKYRSVVGDHETPLTSRGKQQAMETGQKIVGILPPPDKVFFSPYQRTWETLVYLGSEAFPLRGLRPISRHDERIREREIGRRELYSDWRFLNVVDPEQGRLHQLRKDFYYVYPQGESINDVYLRTRQWFGMLRRKYGGRRVWAFTHHLTILSIRGLLEGWQPDGFCEVNKTDPPANCSLTIFEYNESCGKNGKLVLRDYNLVLYSEDSKDAS